MVCACCLCLGAQLKFRQLAADFSAAVIVASWPAGRRSIALLQGLVCRFLGYEGVPGKQLCS